MTARRVALPRSPKPYPACRSKYSRPAPLPVLAAEAEKSRKLTWSDALRLSFGVDVLTCPCGGKRRLIAVITQAKMIKKILRHLGLPTDVVLKETQPVWRQNTWHCAGRRKSFSPRASTRPAREPAPNTWRRKPERV